MPLHHAGNTNSEKPNALYCAPLSLDDAQAMYDNWASDPQVTRFMNWPTHENIEGHPRHSGRVGTAVPGPVLLSLVHHPGR